MWFGIAPVLILAQMANNATIAVAENEVAIRIRKCIVVGVIAFDR